MSESSFASQELKVYRFSRIYWLYHLGVGVGAVVGALLCWPLWLMSAGLVLFAIFMIARPFVTNVTVDPSSVTVNAIFSGNSIERSSITAFEVKNTGKGSLLILRGNTDEDEKLVIPDLFSFDDAWNDWLSTYRDLSDDKPISLF